MADRPFPNSLSLSLCKSSTVGLLHRKGQLDLPFSWLAKRPSECSKGPLVSVELAALPRPCPDPEVSLYQPMIDPADHRLACAFCASQERMFFFFDKMIFQKSKNEHRPFDYDALKILFPYAGNPVSFTGPQRQGEPRHALDWTASKLVRE
ncbi:hypothetical protein HI914_02230 [Erysiphe necator]|nr:hypothetical protein HI914_02230 [Erysiphe necator]